MIVKTEKKYYTFNTERKQKIGKGEGNEEN